MSYSNFLRKWRPAVSLLALGVGSIYLLYETFPDAPLKTFDIRDWDGFIFCIFVLIGAFIGWLRKFKGGELWDRSPSTLVCSLVAAFWLPLAYGIQYGIGYHELRAGFAAFVAALILGFFSAWAFITSILLGWMAGGGWLRENESAQSSAGPQINRSG